MFDCENNLYCWLLLAPVELLVNQLSPGCSCVSGCNGCMGCWSYSSTRHPRDPDLAHCTCPHPTLDTTNIFAQQSNSVHAKLLLMQKTREQRQKIYSYWIWIFCFPAPRVDGLLILQVQICIDTVDMQICIVSVSVCIMLSVLLLMFSIPPPASIPGKIV